jgi:hypothetical protein
MKRRTTRVTEDSVKSAIAEAAASRKAGEEADVKKAGKPERGAREAAERAKKFQDLREEAMKRWRKRPD